MKRPKRENYDEGVYGDNTYLERLERYVSFLENQNETELRDAHDYLDMLGIEKTQVYEQGHEHLLSLEHRITFLANGGSPKPVDQRFEAAKAAMQGLLMNPSRNLSFGDCADISVNSADTLLKKLKEVK
jgi:hypothetical protein